MKTTLMATLALAALATGCGGGDADEPDAGASPSEKASLTVTGTVEVPIDIQAVMKEKKPTIGVTPCRADDGYDDVRSGAQVTVRDADGATVALGQLEEGLLGGEDGDMLLTAPCTFAFAVEAVPAGGKFYSVEVAHRGEVSYNETDLVAPLTLTLGD